jgi:hypothetical protein
MRNDAVARWDAIASRFLQQTGGGPTPDAFVLAVCCDLQLHARHRKGALLRGRDVYYDATQPRERQRGLVAQCVARWLLRRARVAASPAAIARVVDFITGKRPLARATVLAVVVNLAAATGTHL